MAENLVHSRTNSELIEFYDRLKCFYLMEKPAPQGSRRKSERLELTMPVSVNYIDGDSAESECAISRDLSELGIGLVMHNPIRRNEVLLTLRPWDGDDFIVLAKVVFCEEVGYYYHVGLEFVTH